MTGQPKWRLFRCRSRSNDDKSELCGNSGRTSRTIKLYQGCIQGQQEIHKATSMLLNSLVTIVT